jgi:hypothetical protein
MEPSADPRLYMVGAKLRFIGYDPDEVAYLADDGVDDGPLNVGDLLRVLPENKCGMGIDVVRESDGTTEMVWPNEVELA